MDNSARDIRNRIGNWNDQVDNNGNGSLIAILKNMVNATGNGVALYSSNTGRDLSSRIGNWNDDVDNAGNGSLIAQIKYLPTISLFQPHAGPPTPPPSGWRTYTDTNDGNRPKLISHNGDIISLVPED